MPVLIVAVSLTEKESNLKTIVITMIPLLYRTYVHFGMNESFSNISRYLQKKKVYSNPSSNDNILTLQPDTSILHFQIYFLSFSFYLQYLF